MPVSKALKRLRNEVLKKTQEEMAKLVGVSLRGYTQWESGETSPRGKHLVTILQLCPSDIERNLFTAAAQAAEDLPKVSSKSTVKDIEAEVEKEVRKVSKRLKGQPRELYRQVIRTILILGHSKQNGDRAAGEALRSISKALLIAIGNFHPGDYSNARRVKIMIEALVRASRVDG